VFQIGRPIPRDPAARHGINFQNRGIARDNFFCGNFFKILFNGIFFKGIFGGIFKGMFGIFIPFIFYLKFWPFLNYNRFYFIFLLFLQTPWDLVTVFSAAPYIRKFWNFTRMTQGTNACQNSAYGPFYGLEGQQEARMLKIDQNS